MKLTTFEKVNYLDDQPTLHAAVMKKLDYKEHGATVLHVDVIRGQLEVTLQIKGVRK